MVSPDREVNGMNQKGLIEVAGIVALIMIALGVAYVGYSGIPLIPSTPIEPESTGPGKIVYFSNAQQIIDAFSPSPSGGMMGGSPLPMMGVAESGRDATASMPTKSDASGTTYSTTNVQVEGVDEADIVKTDGKYIYAFYKNKIMITQAYPAEDAHIVGTISLDNVTPREMFVTENKLVVFGDEYQNQYWHSPAKIMGGIAESIYPYWGYSSTVVQQYDISDKTNPILQKELKFRGNYHTSRLIGNNVYFVTSTYPDYQILRDADGVIENPERIIPPYIEDGVERPLARPDRIGYIPPIRAESFVTLSALNLDSRELINETIVGSAETVYASQNSIYLAHTQWNYGYPVPLMGVAVRSDTVLPNMGSGTSVGEGTSTQTGEQPPVTSDEIAEDGSLVHDVDDSTVTVPEYDPIEGTPVDKPIPVPAPMDNQTYTIIHQFDLNDGRIAYVGKGKVPGHVLNQFSMDEHNRFFRIATTTDAQWDSFGVAQSQQKNNVYVLNDEMELVGTLEGLAPGEKIYSARFIGDRAYLVTFKQVDPLFVIDLSNPRDPRVLGKLKIPGYSNYLHPIDDTHIIGIGKDAEVSKNDFAYYLGMKLAIFDVSDVTNPKQMHQLVVGDRGTDSPALYDHKAFLFDKEKELMVLPIQLNLISDAQKEQMKTNSQWQDWPAYGEPVFQGAIAYRVNLADGFKEIGKVTHIDAETDLKSGYYWDYQYQVNRSLFIENVLYTISSKMIKANDLSNGLEEIKTIPFVNIPKTFSISSKVEGSFCAGPCGYSSVLITKDKIHTETFSGGENGYLNTSEYPAHSQYDDLVELLDWETFKALDETLGCPGCADGPVQTVTISDGNEKKTIKMEPGMDVEGLNEFFQQLANYGGGYYYPMMEGDPMPVDIGGGIGDTPPASDVLDAE